MCSSQKDNSGKQSKGQLWEQVICNSQKEIYGKRSRGEFWARHICNSRNDNSGKQSRRQVHTPKLDSHISENVDALTFECIFDAPVIVKSIPTRNGKRHSIGINAHTTFNMGARCFLVFLEATPSKQYVGSCFNKSPTKPEDL